MRVAAIDCGTNTLLLLVADLHEQRATAIEERAEIVRLGERLDATGELQPQAIARALTVLTRYVTRIRELECDYVIGVGTEAIRGARNGSQFVTEATRLLGAVGGRFQVIDGVREARLAWRAAKASFPALEGVRTVVDIGGGSTELLVGVETPDQVVSLPIGSVRLTERLLAHDPPTEEERAELKRTVAHALEAALEPRGTVIGIAGTVTTLAAMNAKLAVYDGDRVHGSTLPAAAVTEMATRLGITPVADRRRTPGLDPGRAQVIYAGAVILEQVLARAQASGCLVSDRGIRWGLVCEAAGIG